MRIFVACWVGLLVVCAPASATIQINFTSADVPNDPITLQEVAHGSVAQLVWSPDGTIDAVNPFNPTGAGLNNDIVLFTDSVINPGGGFPAFIFGSTEFYDATDGSLGIPSPYNVEDGLIHGIGISNGMVYARIFNSASPTTNEFYTVGGVVGGDPTGMPPDTLADQDPTPSGAQLSRIEDGNMGWRQIVAPIPEPSSLGFILVAALLIGGCARRARFSPQGGRRPPDGV